MGRVPAGCMRLPVVIAWIAGGARYRRQTIVAVVVILRGGVISVRDAVFASRAIDFVARKDY